MERIMTRPEPDPAAVSRAVAGDPPRYMSVSDRIAAVRELAAQGRSDAETCRRLNLSHKRVVLRIRKTNGIPAGRHSGSGRPVRAAS